MNQAEHVSLTEKVEFVINSKIYLISKVFHDHFIGLVTVRSDGCLVDICKLKVACFLILELVEMVFRVENVDFLLLTNDF